MRHMEKYSRAGQATDDKTIRRMRIACWIPKATNTHSEYVILIVVPLQQWLHERASMLRYTYIACLVLSSCTRILDISMHVPASNFHSNALKTSNNLKLNHSVRTEQ
jgi:hypothetical protein